MGGSCVGQHLLKWHVHLGATCNAEENLLMVNLFDRTKFHGLKYDRGRKNIYILPERE